ncbi:hypothetical protein XaFJ1_GM000212 [Xanthomonas albilineans]|nr:hypothetical protein XaFJ1_GM000212 [Xanthomonas albilineans]
MQRCAAAPDDPTPSLGLRNRTGASGGVPT